MRKFASRMTALLFFLLPLVTNAQTTITGKVLDAANGQPAPGITVIVKGKNVGTKTDNQGGFNINAIKGELKKNAREGLLFGNARLFKYSLIKKTLFRKAPIECIGTSR